MHLAYVSVGAIGHVLPTLPSVAELVQKGARVTYFAPEFLRKMIEQTGASFAPVESSLTNQGKANDDIEKDLLAELPLRFLTEAKGTISQILPTLVNDKPDAIMADQLAIAGRLAASYLKVPLIQVYTSYAANSHFSISRHWPTFPDPHPARVAANKLAQEFTAEYGVGHLDVFGIFEDKGDFNIVTLQRKFHPAGETFDDSFAFTGAQIGTRVDFGQWRCPANDMPVIYASLGTLFNDRPDFFAMLFTAVSDLPVNLIASIGSKTKAESLGTIPSNVTVGPFWPQLDILEQASLFITHAGTGSVMEAIWFGVPMVCVPQMDEQAMTASRVAELGLGKAMPLGGELTSDLLREPIETLLSGGAPRMKEFHQDMRENCGSEKSADAVLGFMKKRTES
jgi:MGT family glycosyltransferase